MGVPQRGKSEDFITQDMAELWVRCCLCLNYVSLLTFIFQLNHANWHKRVLEVEAKSKVAVLYILVFLPPCANKKSLPFKQEVR
jgi:hypothetical protein